MLIDEPPKGFDKHANLLYVSLRQTFTLWFVPLSLWQANVKLVTVLHLERVPVDSRNKPLLNDKGEVPKTSDNDILNDQEEEELILSEQPPKLYFIKGQEDHYHVEDFLKFIAPWGASLLWAMWQLLATIVCAIGVVLLRRPIIFLQERVLGLDSLAIRKKP